MPGMGAASLDRGFNEGPLCVRTSCSSYDASPGTLLTRFIPWPISAMYDVLYGFWNNSYTFIYCKYLLGSVFLSHM